MTTHTVTVRLTSDDITMIKAFVAWGITHPTCSPKKHEIEFGYGEHKFRQLMPRTRVPYFSKIDRTGPNTFKRLVAIGVIEHSRNGHCWLTAEGKRVAEQIH